MLKATQCTTVFVERVNAVSGSSLFSTKVTVPCGTLLHSSFGDTGVATLCVYFAGISAPSANAVVVSVRPGPAGPRPPPAGGWAGGCAESVAVVAATAR